LATYICNLKKLYQNETKTFEIVPGLFKDKRKLLVIPKKFGNGPKQAFGPKVSISHRKRFVLVHNFVKKTNVFDLFWNKSCKTKAFDLERTLV
jgi:hypothetical protein